VKTQEVIFPFQKQAINNVLRGLKETMHKNFVPSFLAVAGSVLGLQYEAIIKAGLHFPIPVLCGEHRLGKTKSAKAALHLMGNHNNFFASARLCSRSTFPPRT